MIDDRIYSIYYSTLETFMYSAYIVINTNINIEHLLNFNLNIHKITSTKINTIHFFKFKIATYNTGNDEWKLCSISTT